MFFRRGSFSCGHCVGHVEEALKEISGVNSVSVNLEDKIAIVELAYEVDNQKFNEAIEEVGYKIVKIER